MSGIFNAAIFNDAIFNTGGIVPPVVTTTVDGSGLRFLRRQQPAKLHPEEIARQQRMVQEYLDELDRKRAAEEKRAKQKYVPARQAKRSAAAPPVPRLTENMVKAATQMHLHRILEAAAVADEDRKTARAEFERRYWAAFITLAMED